MINDFSLYTLQEVSMYRGRAHAAEDQLRQARLQVDSAVSGRKAMQAQLEAAENAQAGLEVGCCSVCWGGGGNTSAIQGYATRNTHTHTRTG